MRTPSSRPPASRPHVEMKALQMVRKGGTVNGARSCAKGTEVKVDPWTLRIFGDQREVHVPSHRASCAKL